MLLNYDSIKRTEICDNVIKNNRIRVACNSISTYRRVQSVSPSCLLKYTAAFNCMNEETRRTRGNPISCACDVFLNHLVSTEKADGRTSDSGTTGYRYRLS